MFKQNDKVKILRGEHAGKQGTVSAVMETWLKVVIRDGNKSVEETYQQSELEPEEGVTQFFANMASQRATVSSNVFEATQKVAELEKELADLKKRFGQMSKAQTDTSSQLRLLSSFTNAIAKTEPEQPKRKNVEVRFETWVFGSQTGTAKLQSLLNEGWSVAHEQTVAQGQKLVYTVRLERENVIKVTPERATAHTTLHIPKTAIANAIPVNINLEAGLEALTKMAQEGASEDEILYQARVMSLGQTLGMIDTASKNPQPMPAFSAYGKSTYARNKKGTTND